MTDHSKKTSSSVHPAVLAAAFVSGGAVMVVEVVGSRVLGPFFGVGLFVWSALLSVTLSALAVGYALGGWLSDRRGSASLVFSLLVVAGALVSLIPLSSVPVLRWCDALGIRLGTLVSAFLLFAPALLVMGMVTTAATRQAVLTAATTGRGVGLVYALSTLGGLAGTLLAGFLLVPNFTVRGTFLVTGALLVLVGLLGSVWYHRSLHASVRRNVVGALFPLLGALPPPTATLDQITILERAQSLQGSLSVVQDDSRSEPLRLLRADHSFIGGHWVEGREPAFGFVHILEAVRLAQPRGRELLQIGLGIGSVSTALSKVGIRTDVVEIDPEVVRLAREYFDYQPSGDVYLEDARTLIRRLTKKYDFIVHDAFTGGWVPEHLLSVEVLQQLRELLRPGGVLALNVVGVSRGPLAAPVLAIDRTLRHVFPHVRAFRDSPLERNPERVTNLVFFAAATPIAFESPSSFESERCREVQTQFERWELELEGSASSPLVTDAHNPLGLLALPNSEAVRAALRQMYPAEFWLR